MCSPTALLGAQVAGGAAQTVGAYYGAQAQRSQLGFQADMADMQAGQALQAGEREQQRSRLSTGQLKSKQIASMAANGIALDGGTANAVLTSTDVLGEVDANTIEQNALMSAWGYRTEAAMGRARAKAISPKMAAATTLLGSATQVASSWYSMNKGGLFAGADVTKANLSNDPIGSLGKSRGWWSS